MKRLFNFDTTNRKYIGHEYLNIIIKYFASKSLSVFENGLPIQINIVHYFFLSLFKIQEKSHIRATQNISTNANSSTDIFVSAGVKKGAHSNFLGGLIHPDNRLSTNYFHHLVLFFLLFFIGHMTPDI